MEYALAFLILSEPHLHYLNLHVNSKKRNLSINETLRRLQVTIVVVENL